MSMFRRIAAKFVRLAAIVAVLTIGLGTCAISNGYLRTARSDWTDRHTADQLRSKSAWVDMGGMILAGSVGLMLAVAAAKLEENE